MRKFIAKLQNSDETTKKIWLVFFSGISMMLVVSFWLVYLDRIVAQVGNPDGTPAIAQNSQEKSDAPGFFAIFGAGVKTIFDALKEKLAVRNNIVIESPKINFVSEDVEPISPTKLDN